jgi:hypothetical protein
LPTDAVYLARFDTERYEELMNHDTVILNTGSYEADTLYIIESPYAKAASQHVKAERDLLTVVDGYTVVAPHWKYIRSDKYAGFTTKEDTVQ